MQNAFATIDTRPGRAEQLTQPRLRLVQIKGPLVHNGKRTHAFVMVMLMSLMIVLAIVVIVALVMTVAVFFVPGDLHGGRQFARLDIENLPHVDLDRKSTRLNS